MVFLDRAPCGPWCPIWSALGGRGAYTRAQWTQQAPAFADDARLIPRAVLSPNSDSNFLWKHMWFHTTCERESPLLRDFRAFMLPLLDPTMCGGRSCEAPAGTPRAITLIERKPRHGKSGKLRNIRNFAAVVAAVTAAFPREKVQAVDFAALEWAAQYRVARTTKLLIGMHGGGLTWSMFLPRDAGIIELNPAPVQQGKCRPFCTETFCLENMAHWIGLRHIGWRTERTDHDMIPLGGHLVDPAKMVRLVGEMLAGINGGGGGGGGGGAVGA